jgi:hypothetical protein
VKALPENCHQCAIQDEGRLHTNYWVTLRGMRDGLGAHGGEGLFIKASESCENAKLNIHVDVMAEFEMT